jgi:hypothetical protein
MTPSRLGDRPRFWLTLPTLILFVPLGFMFAPWMLVTGAIVLNLVASVAIFFVLRSRQDRNENDH